MTFAKSMRDLLEGNLISGYTKAVEALVIACSLAGGVGLTLSISCNAHKKKRRLSSSDFLRFFYAFYSSLLPSRLWKA